MLFQWANNLHRVPCFPAHQLWKDGWSGVMTVPGNKQDFVTTRMGFMPQWRIWESSTNPGWYSGGCAWERAKIATGIKWHKPQEKALLTFHHQKQRCPHRNDRLNFTFSISKAPLLFHKTACGESRTPHSTWSLFTLQKPQMPGTRAYCSLSADTNPLKRLVCASRAKKRRGKKEWEGFVDLRWMTYWDRVERELKKSFWTAKLWAVRVNVYCCGLYEVCELAQVSPHGKGREERICPSRIWVA